MLQIRHSFGCETKRSREWNLRSNAGLFNVVESKNSQADVLTWEIDHSETAEMFDERMSSFRGWFESKEQEWSKPVKEMTAKLFKRSDQ